MFHFVAVNPDSFSNHKCFPAPTIKGLILPNRFIHSGLLYSPSQSIKTSRFYSMPEIKWAYGPPFKKDKLVLCWLVKRNIIGVQLLQSTWVSPTSLFHSQEKDENFLLFNDSAERRTMLLFLMGKKEIKFMDANLTKALIRTFLIYFRRARQGN